MLFSGIMLVMRILFDLTAAILPSLVGKYAIMDRQAKVSYMGKVVSAIHAVFAVILSYDALYSCESEPQNTFLNSDKCLFEVSAKQRASATFTAGYMFYDFFYVTLFYASIGSYER